MKWKPGKGDFFVSRKEKFMYHLALRDGLITLEVSKDKKISWIKTTLFNLETFFGHIRQINASNRSPTTYQFKAAFKTVVIHDITGTKHNQTDSNSGYLDDEDLFVFDLEQFMKISAEVNNWCSSRGQGTPVFMKTFEYVKPFPIYRLCFTCHHLLSGSSVQMRNTKKRAHLSHVLYVLWPKLWKILIPMLSVTRAHPPEIVTWAILIVFKSLCSLYKIIFPKGFSYILTFPRYR